MHRPEPPWVAQRASEARLVTYRVELNRPWWVMLIAGLTAIAIYLHDVLGRPVTGIDGELFFNLRFGGLVLATVVSCVALTLTVRGKWPAAFALAGMAPIWVALARSPGDRPWVRTFGDGVMLAALVLLPMVALAVLIFPRPEPPPDLPGGGLPPAHLRAPH